MKIEDVENMSLDDVKKKHDEVQTYVVESLSTWQKIYEWKRQELLNQRLEKINTSMLNLTKIVTFLTAINVIVAVISIIVNFI